MAELSEAKERTRSQEVVGGARVRGSWEGGGGGKRWRFRGRIWWYELEYRI